MFTLETIVPVAAFLAITLVAWVVLTAVGSHRGSADERLGRILDQTRHNQTTGGTQRMQERLQQRMTQAAEKLSKHVQPKDEVEIGKIKEKLLNAGFRHPQAVQIFMGIKLLCLLIALGIATPLVLTRLGTTRNGMTAIALAAAAGFYLPGMVVGHIRKKRQDGIFLGLPDALDLMVVCVEAGLGFDAAMRRVTQEMTTSCPVLAEEFNIVNFQMQMGRPRREVMRDLGVRTGVEDVRSLAAVIIQAERFGSSIGSALRVQSEAMRIRRKQIAEERAAKTAVKIMIPLILFIFPGVFVVLVGPAGIQIAQNMVK